MSEAGFGCRRGYLVARGVVHGLADAYVQRNVALLRHLVLNKQPTNTAREDSRSLPGEEMERKEGRAGAEASIRFFAQTRDGGAL